MNKIKIGIDLVDIWENFGDFKEVMKDISLDTEGYQLYIISTETNEDLIASAKALLGLDDQFVIQTTDDTTTVQSLVDNKIDIYMTGNNPLVILTNETETTKGVLVNSIPDRYKMQSMWLTNMNFWIGQINKTTSEKNC